MPPLGGIKKGMGVPVGLLYFPVEGMATKMRIKFFLLHAPLLELLIAGRHVTGDRFALTAGFGAFEDDVFSWHGKFK